LRKDNRSLFVNMQAEDLDEAWAAPLLATGIPIVLEVTERATLRAIPDLHARVGRLRGQGFRIAIDDLGAGYAGLTSFAALEPDIVKLDMALVRNVDREPLKQKLIASLASVCRDLNILVVAEGIETEGERRAATDLGCDLLQGYLLGRPQAMEIGP
jgi:EAL domain-containing protein (putative c-di-GMP-specific phosphodiesterase class I)